MTLNKENHITPYCINLEDTKDDSKALLTHYIHDKKKNSLYKKQAIQYVKQTLLEEHEEVHKINEVAEEALQQLIFTRNKEQIPFGSK